MTKDLIKRVFTDSRGRVITQMAVRGDDPVEPERELTADERHQQRVTAILRGLKDGLRDEVLADEDVGACFDDKTLAALERVVEKATEKRRGISKEKRRPWRTRTRDEVLRAQEAAGLRGSKVRVRTFPASVSVKGSSKNQ